MKILVLGANGQVGSELGTQLGGFFRSEQGVKITLANRSNVDLTDLRAVRRFLIRHEPEWIINASAYTSVDKAEAEPYAAHAVNELAVQALAEYCTGCNARLIHISTDYVFDGSGEQPFSEESAVAPLGVYGASKVSGEEAIRAILAQHLILRTAWVFGASGSNFVRTMLHLAETKSQLGVVGDQFGAPTSARSIARTIACLAFQMRAADSDDKRWGTYHYTGYPYVSWAGFASEIFQQAKELGVISGTPIVNAISTDEYPTPARRPHNSRLDCSKITKVFDIEPDNWQRSLNEVLDEMKREGKV